MSLVQIEGQCPEKVQGVHRPVRRSGVGFRMEDEAMDGLVEMKFGDLWEDLRVKMQGGSVLIKKSIREVSHHGCQFTDLLGRGDGHQEEDLHGLGGPGSMSPGV